VRTILLELKRVWNHLNDIAAICAGVGLAAGNNAFAPSPQHPEVRDTSRSRTSSMR
jgi:NADH:ubiquinone oxidoreductase subunit D